MRQAIMITVLVSASGCATTKNIVSIAQCGVADDRLGKVVTDPAAVVDYFRRMIAEGREIGLAIKTGEPTSLDAGAWIADMLDLIDRMNGCVPRELARDAEVVLSRVRSIRGSV